MTDNAFMPVVRVGIISDNRLTELALPSDRPLREILPAVQRLLLPVDAEEFRSERLSLAAIGGIPFSLGATLQTVGVVEGDLLALRPLPVGPAAVGVVEDIADAAAIVSSQRFWPWGPRLIQIGARAATMVFLLLFTGFLTVHAVIQENRTDVLTLAAIALGSVAIGLVARRQAPAVAMDFSVVALAPIACALALAVPGGWGAPRIVLAAAGLAAWSFLSMIVSAQAVGFFTGVAVINVGLLLAAGIRSLCHVPLLALGCGLLAFSVLVTIQAATLSAIWARFPLPIIPAPGDPTPAPPSVGVLVHLPRRIKIGDSHQIGFLAAGVITQAIASILVLWPFHGAQLWSWYLVVGAGIATALRARVWESALCKSWLLSAPYIVATSVAVALFLAGRYDAGFWALGVLGAQVLVWVVVGLVPRVTSPDNYSLPVRRTVGFISGLLDASLLPVIGYLCGVFDVVLNR